MASMMRSFFAVEGQANSHVLDGPEIAQSMTGAPGIASVSFRNTSPSAITGQVRISNVNDFLSITDGSEFIAFTQRTTGGRLIININRDNGHVVLGLLSTEISDYLEIFMAPIITGDEITKTEYLDLVAGFYNRAISNEIANSRIRASIDFPGTIRTVRGGTFSGRRANFDIPLIDILVLESPMVFEVVWN